MTLTRLEHKISHLKNKELGNSTKENICLYQFYTTNQHSGTLHDSNILHYAVSHTTLGPAHGLDSPSQLSNLTINGRIINRDRCHTFNTLFHTQWYHKS